jgi:hypothetical protein
VSRRILCILLILLLCVTLAHLLALRWAAGQAPVALHAMAEPVFARVVTPQAIPKARADKRAKGPPPTQVAAAPSAMPDRPTTELGETAPMAEAPADTATETPTEPDIQAPVDSAAPAPAPKDPWPASTRLSYQIKGYYRGDFYGDAKVQWQRQDPRYQVQLDLRLALFIRLTLTSQGMITSTGLAPDIYEEVRPGRREQLTIVDQEIRLNDGKTTPKPEGVQDTASQFVELSHRFATGREVLKVGGEVSLWLARPNGVDLWTYDVVAEDTLQTPKLGAVQAFHLKPRPLANPRGPVMAEIWFAPSLQYLPVRILITQGDSTYVELIVEKIEQTEVPTVEPSKTP